MVLEEGEEVKALAPQNLLVMIILMIILLVIVIVVVIVIVTVIVIVIVIVIVKALLPQNLEVVAPAPAPAFRGLPASPHPPLASADSPSFAEAGRIRVA